MKTEQLKEALQEATRHPRHGRDTRRMVEAFGEAEVTQLLEGMLSPSFNWSGLREACVKAEEQGLLKESVAESAFSSLLRLGVETIIKTGYEVPDTIHQNIMLETSSTSLYQPYAWTNRAELPKEVPAGGEFDDSRVVPWDVVVKNRKFGRRLAFETELFEDDQTGEVQRKSSELGENMQTVKEIWFAGFLSGAAYTFGDTKVPAPVYRDPDPAGSTSVFVAAATNTRRTNKTNAAESLDLTNFKGARTALRNMKDSLGNRVSVRPDTLVVATNLEYDGAQLMNAAWYPAATDTTTSARAVDYNPIKGMANVQVCRWLPDSAWYVGQAKSRSLVFQRRTGLQVLQENPSAGESFKLDKYIFRVRERWTMFWGDARYWYQGHA
jgi:phage major head subunit gpT-like protein